jgi:hypothetical protein
MNIMQVVERLQTLQTVFVDAYLKTRKLEMAEAAQSHFALGIKVRVIPKCSRMGIVFLPHVSRSTTPLVRLAHGK